MRSDTPVGTQVGASEGAFDDHKSFELIPISVCFLWLLKVEIASPDAVASVTPQAQCILDIIHWGLTRHDLYLTKHSLFTSHNLSVQQK